ncbi:IclR family transcriptional regulator [Castellaniella sp.]|uniref:IclR family transcriptional regulator n=1 Tax=Castellaniella sp. TaxID=1955812 RepID=UPI002AFE414B|nr:IclR family transcriptional regulator [Castellaniella sp.]
MHEDPSPLSSKTRRRTVVAKTVLSNEHREGAGTQLIHRSMRILRMLASSPPQGETVANISSFLGLTQPTTYRIIKALEREGVVQQASGSHGYTIGAELAWMALGTLPKVLVTQAAAPALEQLSKAVEDSVFLAVRSGFDSIYVDRRLGRYPVQEVELCVGSRRPIGVNVAGRAMLGFLPQETVESIMQANEPRFAAFSIPLGDILRDAALSRKQGYVWNDSLTAPDRRSLAAPILDLSGNAVAAICVIARQYRLPESRIPQIVPYLIDAARQASEKLAAASRAPAGRT